MSINFTKTLGGFIEPPKYRLVSDFFSGGRVSRSSGRGAMLDNRPVLQVNVLPVTLSPRSYANPHSNTNPSGSYTSLYAFSQLVDPIPSFTQYYSPSLSVISSVYKNLVHGASVRRGERYTESVLAGAMSAYDLGSFSNMDGIPGAWYPAYATPVDWYDTNNHRRFQEITIDLSGDADNEDAPYQILSQSSSNNLFSTLRTNADGSSILIDDSTSLKSVNFKYLEVRLNRPWLNFEIFNLDGWFLSGQDVGYFSSGNVAENPGVVPLITTSILVAIEVEVEAKWSARDQKVLDEAKKNGGTVAVGPFVTDSDNTFENELHVIGRISQLVPLAPQIAR